jgi:hypothetical protein
MTTTAQDTLIGIVPTFWTTVRPLPFGKSPQQVAVLGDELVWFLRIGVVEIGTVVAMFILKFECPTNISDVVLSYLPSITAVPSGEFQFTSPVYA